ncbi:MAG: FAD-dependent oxidoreductase, partial [Saprospiraceae bacterium]|nr:FAD-dependent oxidoreductase [Saprospiraceae bacterium]
MTKKSIHIIGGGVIGLCAAYFLNKEGVKVTVIDKTDLSDGTSHGNAGMIVPSHFVPLASPGVISQGIKWMFDSKSPFYVKPRLNIELAQWMWRFYKSCTRKNVNRAIPVLFDFNQLSKQLYKEFSEMKDFSFCFEEKGLLMLYQSVQQEKEEKEMAEKAHAIGLEADLLSGEEIQNIEPGIKLSAKGGLFFPGDAHLYPNTFLQQLILYLKQKGVQFNTGATVEDFSTSNGKVESLRMSDGKQISIDNILLCGGSWTGKMLKKLGIKLDLQDGKGYSITLPNPPIKPSIPTILSEAKVAVTPMGDDLRIGGTLEISNFSTQININRLKGIIENVPKYYPELQLDIPKKEEVWYGYRPCTPDGMPYVDQSAIFTNLFVGTGHGMMGMSLGPATGKMLCELFLEEK